MEMSEAEKEQQANEKKKMPRQALGRGLNALIPGSEQTAVESEPTNKRVVNIEINSIKRNPHQPRLSINEEKLAELSESIREKGIIQPVIVRKTDDGYELIAGERRTLAARKAGFEMVPAIIYNVSNEESLEFALIENIQRDDLNPLELANAYQMLINEFSLTQEEVSAKVGKDRASVANYLRLLMLPQRVKQLVSDGKLSFGHARALLSLEDEAELVLLAGIAVKEDLSVRQCENLVMSRSLKGKKQKQRKLPGRKGTVEINYDINSLEEKLRNTIGTKVKITPKKKGGLIEIEYYSLDELERIIEFFEIEPGD